MNKDTQAYNNQQADDKLTCDILAELINKNLPQAQSKVWHAHPVWFLDGSTVAG